MKYLILSCKISYKRVSRHEQHPSEPNQGRPLFEYQF